MYMFNSSNSIFQATGQKPVLCLYCNQLIYKHNDPVDFGDGWHWRHVEPLGCAAPEPAVVARVMRSQRSIRSEVR